MRGDHNMAIAQFDKMKGNEGQYSNAIKYYRAHVAYENGNLDKALASFLELEKDDGFRTASTYYIAHIFYLQGHYSEAIRYAQPLTNGNSDKVADMTRIVADSHFMQSDYKTAVQDYEKLLKITKSPLRADYYHAGMSYYNTDDYDASAKMLGKVTSEKDELAQNAYYHLASCYLKNGDKKAARTAFEAASKYDYDKAISEDALFNKLKLAYELNFSPFDELTTGFVEFLDTYPNSPHSDEAFDLMSKAFVSTKNYKKALETMEKIKHKSLRIYTAMQRISFYRLCLCSLRFVNTLILRHKSSSTTLYATENTTL